ncbi:MAG: hypothetical protein M0D55_16845 [Elusimicrobiota bacterium]|nr:MAG: hypothetical protein M0D55_16845 [Elusimicrobiota bacterium]
MNESLPCPGCSTPLPPEATGCQICMRARTKQEIVRGYAYLREERARRRALPFKIAGAVAVIALTAKLSWDNRVRILAAAEAGKQYAAAKYDKFIDAKSYAPKVPAATEPPPVNPADLPKTDPKSPFASPPPVPDYLKRTVGSGAGSGEAGRGSSAPAEEPAPRPRGRRRRPRRRIGACPGPSTICRRWSPWPAPRSSSRATTASPSPRSPPRTAPSRRTSRRRGPGPSPSNPRTTVPARSWTSTRRTGSATRMSGGRS